MQYPELALVGKTVHAHTTEVRSGSSSHPAGLPHEFPRLFSVVNAASHGKLLFFTKVTEEDIDYSHIRNKLAGLIFTDLFSSWPLKKLK